MTWASIPAICPLPTLRLKLPGSTTYLRITTTYWRCWAWSRCGRETARRAQKAFATAVARADALLTHTAQNYRALDTKGLALCGLLLDQASKYAVFDWLQRVEGHGYALFQTPQGGFQLVAQFENGVPHVNHGALFGFLRGHKTLANGGFALISLLAAVAIAYWSTQKSTASDRWAARPHRPD